MTIALHWGGVKPFSYTEDILNDLEASVSPERMGTYLNATGGNREKAFHLYAWNTATSAAFYGPLQGTGGGIAERHTPATRRALRCGLVRQPCGWTQRVVS